MYKSALIMIATAAVAVTASAHASSANEFGTIEEAKAMLKRAVVAVQQDKIAAINKFNYNDQQFRDRDLFVFCFNGLNGKYTAHEAMVGHDVRAFRDAKGQPVGQRMYEIAADGKVVSVDYMSPVPGSTELALKRAYLTRVGDQVCGVSAYEFELTPNLSVALKERVAMETFYMSVTLSSITGPQVLFISQPKPWKNELACVRALPRMEGAVTRLIRFDASALDLFGTGTSISLKPGYFVSGSECMPAEAGGP
jgi:signal transduction histidine kinase